MTHIVGHQTITDAYILNSDLAAMHATNQMAACNLTSEKLFKSDGLTGMFVACWGSPHNARERNIGSLMCGLVVEHHGASLYVVPLTSLDEALKKHRRHDDRPVRAIRIRWQWVFCALYRRDGIEVMQKRLTDASRERMRMIQEFDLKLYRDVNQLCSNMTPDKSN